MPFSTTGVAPSFNGKIARQFDNKIQVGGEVDLSVFPTANGGSFCLKIELSGKRIFDIKTIVESKKDSTICLNYTGTNFRISSFIDQIEIFLFSN